MSAKKPKAEEPTATHSSAMAAMGLPVAAGTLAVQVWSDMGAEMVRFFRDRMQQDIQAQQAMLACTSLEELRQVQTKFFAAAQEQYAAEAVKMLELMGKAASSGLPSSTQARRYDDVPL